MAGSLDKFSENDLAPKDVRGRRSLLKRMAAFHNAALNTQIFINGQRATGNTKRTITDGNETWEFEFATTGGSTVDLSPFALADVSDKGGAKVSVQPGGLNGKIPDNFPTPGISPLILSVSVGDQIYAKVTGNTASGGAPIPITSRQVLNAATVPADDPANATFHYLIGSYDLDHDGNGPFVRNAAYGAIDLNIYRVLFSAPTSFGVVASSGR